MRLKSFLAFLKEGHVIPFKPKPDDQKAYRDAFEKQHDHEHRFGVGVEPCEYCGELNCDFDCDESQAGGFNKD